MFTNLLNNADGVTTGGQLRRFRFGSTYGVSDLINEQVAALAKIA